LISTENPAESFSAGNFLFSSLVQIDEIGDFMQNPLKVYCFYDKMYYLIL